MVVAHACVALLWWREHCAGVGVVVVVRVALQTRRGQLRSRDDHAVAVAVEVVQGRRAGDVIVEHAAERLVDVARRVVGVVAEGKVERILRKIKKELKF